MAGQIDQVEQLDLLRLKAGDLRWLYATGRGQTTGFGRNKQHSFRHGVQTPVGDRCLRPCMTPISTSR